jgi:hypothetical protein
LAVVRMMGSSHEGRARAAEVIMNRNIANWLMVGSAVAILGSAALSLIALGISMVAPH